MASVDVLYETPFPQRSTTRVKNACAWDGTGRLVLTPTATREARTGTVDEGQKQSGCPAPLELRRQTAGAGAPCRSASWSPVGLAWDGGALLATVSATGACAVFEPPRCWADYAWATVDDVAAARPGADRLTLRATPRGGRRGGLRLVPDDERRRRRPVWRRGPGPGFERGAAALPARGPGPSAEFADRAAKGFADEAKLRDGPASALAWSETHLFVGDVRGGVAKVGYRAEGGGLSLAADVALRHPDERPVVSFAVGSGVLGVLAGARAELWTDRGCVILPVDDASCLAVLDDERVACGGAAGGARVFGVDGAPKGPLFDGGDVVFGLAPSANGLCAAEIAAEEPDFAKRAEGFARLRVRALGARDAALGNADLRGARGLPLGAPAGDVAGSPCPLCEAPLPLSRRDVLRGAADSACGAGPVDVCARPLSAIPLAEDARTCPACGLRLRDAPDKFPHLGDLAAQCPLCDLGTGAFSRVVKATKRMANNEAGQAVASIEHPNIIKLYNFYEEKKMFYMVIELMEGGELFERIVKKTFYNEKEARDLIRILLDALAYLHHRHIVHRDLKPENLLLKSPYNDFDIKLADFGFAKKVNGKSLDTQCGTPGYVAPEILKGAKYGTEVDMWSCGVIVYILLGGYPPFHDDNHAILYRKIKAADYTFEPQYWDQVSDDAKDLIKKMLVVDPDKRLTADQALRHPWFLVGDHELISRNLSTTLDTMKKFNARRKFRGTVKGIMLTNKMARGFN
ncbi:serine/threonine kinase [Aureococcus anophagefferens]|nr:serine/threonine kinase [Aureococcus anophagefferens]